MLYLANVHPLKALKFHTFCPWSYNSQFFTALTPGDFIYMILRFQVMDLFLQFWKCYWEKELVVTDFISNNSQWHASLLPHVCLRNGGAPPRWDGDLSRSALLPLTVDCGPWNKHALRQGTGKIMVLATRRTGCGNARWNRIQVTDFVVLNQPSTGHTLPLA